MTIMVAFNGSQAADNALALACEKAARSGEKVIVVTSMEGGREESGWKRFNTCPIP